MVKRKGSYSHYELVFERFLRKNNFLYIAINEAKRPVFNGERVKNFDFIVISKIGKIVLVDVKGKQFPYKSGWRENYWENWISLDDGKFLKMWTKIFGENSLGVLAFVT